MRRTDPIRFRIIAGNARAPLRIGSARARLSHIQSVRIDRDTCLRITRNQAQRGRTMSNETVIKALRAVLPLAIDRADEYRLRAAEALQRWPDGKGAEYAAQLAHTADDASAAIAGALSALSDADKEPQTDILRDIVNALKDHPEASRGNSKVHYALCKARTGQEPQE